MLSYRHAFHAGNHADVFKHLVLTLLVRALLQKDKPFCYLDTHSGAGRYDLARDMARKNREYESGIGTLWSLVQVPQEVAGYLDAVRAFNPSGTLRHYPGSPRLVRTFLRPKDRMVLCELHSNEVKFLAADFAGDKQVRTEHMDGYQALRALLPPIERRGLVHIDPSFERKNEWRLVLESVQEGHRRWATGIFAIWFPIQNRHTANDFLRRLERTGLQKILVSELSIHDQDETLRLNGSGMVVINPPWQLDEQLKSLLPWLWEKLAVKGQGGYRVEWLVRE